MTRRALARFLVAAALLFAFGGPAGWLHQRLGHPSPDEHAHAHAHAVEESRTAPDAPMPGRPEPGEPGHRDCPTCHLVLHAGALPPAPAAAPTPGVAAPPLDPAAPAAVATAATRDRPPGRGPPRVDI